MFPKHRWNSIISSFNLQQLNKYPTRVTVNSCTLLDHIFVDIDCSFKEICVVQCGLIDHVPICITLGFDKVKSSPKIHHEIRFRNFNNFYFNAFIADNDFNLFEKCSVYLTQILLYNFGYRILLLSFINMLHIALKELKLESIITGLRVKLNLN